MSNFALKWFHGKLKDDDDAYERDNADDNRHKGGNISHNNLGWMDELKI